MGATLPSLQAEIDFHISDLLIAEKADNPAILALVPRLALLPDLESEILVQKFIARWGKAFAAKEVRAAIKAQRGDRKTITPHGSEHPPDIIAPALYLPNDSAQRVVVNDLARLIMRDHDILLEASGQVREYNGRYWERIPNSKLRSYALALDSHQYTTDARRSEAVKYVLDATNQTEIPWRALGPAEIACQNGVVDVQTCKVRPHRREDYLETVVPHNYDPSQRCPGWLAAMERWFRGDADADSKIAALQEFFGYVLLPHALYKKALFVQGESNTGKSQIPLIIGELVGFQNRCTLSTEQMADERKRAPIVGKMVNLLTELPADAMIQDGGFKQLVSTGDPISVDPKWVHPFDYTPFCKHVICCNTLPAISDLSRATFNRLLLIQFNHVLAELEQDKNILDKLKAELPGILAWAVEGADRLIRNNGEFTKIEESTAAVEEYRKRQNSVHGFIEEYCVKDEDGKLSMEEFRNKFRPFYGKPIGDAAITRMLKSAGYVVKPGWVGTKSTRCVVGLSWG
jgi:P4 family phage/plasmid primase-like protien